MTRTLSFDEIKQLRFADKAAELAANPRFSGEGHPVVTEGDLVLNLLYTRPDGTRLVCLTYNDKTDVYSLALEQDMPSEPDTSAGESTTYWADKADLPALREPKALTVPERPDDADKVDQVTMTFRVGSSVVVNGEATTITAVTPYKEGSDMLGFARLTSVGVALANGLFLEVSHG